IPFKFLTPCGIGVLKWRCGRFRHDGGGLERTSSRRCQMDNRSSGNYPRRPSDGLAQGEWDEKTSGATARSHFRLCHFCLHLNESHTVISQCERCHRSLRNPADSRNLYHRIARHLEDSMSEEEW